MGSDVCSSSSRTAIPDPEQTESTCFAHPLPDRCECMMKSCKDKQPCRFITRFKWITLPKMIPHSCYFISYTVSGVFTVGGGTPQGLLKLFFESFCFYKGKRTSWTFTIIFRRVYCIPSFLTAFWQISWILCVCCNAQVIKWTMNLRTKDVEFTHTQTNCLNVKLRTWVLEDLECSLLTAHWRHCHQNTSKSSRSKQQKLRSGWTFVMATGCRSAGGGDSLQVNVLASSLQKEFKGEVIGEGWGGGGGGREVRCTVFVCRSTCRLQPQWRHLRNHQI